MAFHQFPYTNYHDLNIDWVLEKINSLEATFTTEVQKAITERVKELFVDIVYDEDTETIKLTISEED